MQTLRGVDSGCVYAVCLHPREPCIVVSLGSGFIQVWNFETEELENNFEAHEAPVRCLRIHQDEQILASGGDDARIRVWNTKSLACSCTLLGHVDKIRAVKFHRFHSWIASASEDKTIRIWDHRTGTCLSVLTDHRHVVTSVSFHHAEDRMISGSLDGKVILWNLSRLGRKQASFNTGSSLLGSSMDKIFGEHDVAVRYEIAAHKSGVSCLEWHPSEQIIVTGAVHGDIKIWLLGESGAVELDKCKTHSGEVSCVLVDGLKDQVFSCSKDGTVRFWNTGRDESSLIIQRDGDRFWMLATHPASQVYAAAHDTGVEIFRRRKDNQTRTCVSLGRSSRHGCKSD